MNIIEVNQLVKTYQQNEVSVQAVRNISMSIKKGDFAAIAGPSGSGKTTLLNMIGGLDQPTSGTIRVGSYDLAQMKQRQLSDMRLNDIGFIFQAYNLIPVLSAIENVEYILLLQGVNKAERFKRAVRMLEEVGLAKEVDRLPKEMSGGQQQRVAVARAIVSEPHIILADEPTANLDQKTGADLLDLMHTLNREKGITFLFSTHDRMVMDRAERLIYLQDGRIKTDETKKSEKKK